LDAWLKEEEDDDDEPAVKHIAFGLRFDMTGE